MLVKANKSMVNPVNWAANNPERQKILNLIVGKQFKPLIRREGLKKDVLAGFVGERGGGKSGSGAVYTLCDYMMDGIKCYSNMKIGLDIIVPTELAAKYNIPWGQIARYRSLPLDLPALLRFEEKFANCCIFLDEINVQISDSRKSMSTCNFFFNRLGQELRHLQSALTYTSTSEMNVDSRIRDLTDVFVMCSDACNTPEGIEKRKPAGEQFYWKVYFLKTCFDGSSYADTKKVSREVIFDFKPWRGVYNDLEFQGQGMMKYGIDIKDFSGSDQSLESFTVEHMQDEWAWLKALIQEYRSQGEQYVPKRKVFEEGARRGFKDKSGITTKVTSDLGLDNHETWVKGRRVEFYKFRN